jgi:hypothetical protein
MRVSNSFSGDSALDVSPEMRVLSNTLIQYQCLQCHSGYSEYTDSQSWIDSGLIIPADADDSPLIRHLRGDDAIMPPSGSPVDDGTIDSIADWINGL